MIGYLEGKLVLDFIGRGNADVLEQIVDGVRVILPIDD